LGQPKVDSGTAIAVDSAGNAYVGGYTNAANFPTTPASVQPTCSCPDLDAVPFVAKLNATATDLLFGTYLAGTLTGNYKVPVLNAIALDGSGNLLVAGAASNTGFPSPSGVQPTSKGGSDAFLLRLDSTGALLQSMFLGGSGNDSAASVAVDPGGNTFLAGSTISSDFPDTLHLFPSAVSFVAELDRNGKTLSAVLLPGGTIDGGCAPDPPDGITCVGASGLVSRINLAGSPSTTLLGAGNAATLGLGGGFASGAVISLYGIQLGPAAAIQAQSINGQLPDTVAGVQVLIDGLPAPLMYVSPSQINAVLVRWVYPGSTEVQLRYNGSIVGQFPIAFQNEAPQIFRNPDGSAIAVNQDGTVNSPSNPAPQGTIVAVWGTGSLGTNNPHVIATEAINHADAVTSLTSQATVVYAGPAPGWPFAVFQANLQTYFSGAWGVVLSVGGVPSQPFTIYGKP